MARFFLCFPVFSVKKISDQGKGRKSPHNSGNNKNIVVWKDSEVDDEDGDFLGGCRRAFVASNYLLFWCCV